MMRWLVIAWAVWLEVIRRKDVYVLLVLLGTLLAVVLSLNVFGLGGTSRYALDVGLLLAWVFGWILAVTVASRQLPDEEERGTVFTLLAKPVTRFDLVMGKYAGSWSVVAAATASFYLLAAGVTAARGGRVDFAALLQAVLLHAVALGVMCGLGLWFSARLHGDAAAALAFVVTAAAFLVVPRAPEFMTRQTGLAAAGLMLLYHLLPHFEVFDMRRRVVHDFGPAAWTDVGLIAAYGFALCACLALLAWTAFRRRRFSRSVP
ncbi:MAG: hypothetical protein FJ225_06100 [Lentisphaerae bacterium]|nr:hypothetical protein [Lentisphaerota bacterium]